MDTDDAVNLLARWFNSANVINSIHLCIDDPGYGPRAFVFVPYSQNRNGKPDCIDAIPREQADHLFRLIISHFNYAKPVYKRDEIFESIVIKEGVILDGTKIHGIYQPMRSSMARRMFLTKDLSRHERGEFNSQADDIDHSLSKVLDAVESGGDNTQG